MKARRLWAPACLAAVLGCDQRTVTERQVNQVFAEVVRPAITKAIAETSTTSASVSGSGQFNNPGYRCDFEGYWVVGVKGTASVTATGIAGQISGSTHAAASQPAEGER